MKNIDPKNIKAFYDQADSPWPQNNKWHDINQFEIKKAIQKLKLSSASIVLNAGSGGNDYGLNVQLHNIDISANKNKALNNFIEGNIEHLPYDSDFFNCVICVGSVLNYCDPCKVIQEFSRVLNQKGQLLLEFESSYSYEYLSYSVYKKNCDIFISNYLSRDHMMWLFSPNYIREILIANNFKINHLYPYHIISGLAMHFLKDENASSKYSILDPIARKIPILRKHSGNRILFCTKL